MGGTIKSCAEERGAREEKCTAVMAAAERKMTAVAFSRPHAAEPTGREAAQHLALTCRNADDPPPAQHSAR